MQLCIMVAPEPASTGERDCVAGSLRLPNLPLAKKAQDMTWEEELRVFTYCSIQGVRESREE